MTKTINLFNDEILKERQVKSFGYDMYSYLNNIYINDKYIQFDDFTIQYFEWLQNKPIVVGCELDIILLFIDLLQTEIYKKLGINTEYDDKNFRLKIK